MSETSMSAVLSTSPFMPDGRTSGEVLCAACVLSASIVRDAGELMKNALGGELKTYSRMVEEATSRALLRLAQKADSKGYRGVYGIQIASPNIVEGGAEIVVVGTGYV